MELTQEYFDKGLATLLEKVVPKDDLAQALNAQTVELNDYIHQPFETQQIYIDERR